MRAVTTIFTSGSGESTLALSGWSATVPSLLSEESGKRCLLDIVLILDILTEVITWRDWVPGQSVLRMPRELVTGTFTLRTISGSLTRLSPLDVIVLSNETRSRYSLYIYLPISPDKIFYTIIITKT